MLRKITTQPDLYIGSDKSYVDNNAPKPAPTQNEASVPPADYWYTAFEQAPNPVNLPDPVAINKPPVPVNYLGHPQNIGSIRVGSPIPAVDNYAPQPTQTIPTEMATYPIDAPATIKSPAPVQDKPVWGGVDDFFTNTKPEAPPITQPMGTPQAKEPKPATDLHPLYSPEVEDFLNRKAAPAPHGNAIKMTLDEIHSKSKAEAAKLQQQIRQDNELKQRGIVVDYDALNKEYKAAYEAELQANINNQLNQSAHELERTRQVVRRPLGAPVNTLHEQLAKMDAKLSKIEGQLNKPSPLPTTHQILLNESDLRELERALDQIEGLQYKDQIKKIQHEQAQQVLEEMRQTHNPVKQNLNSPPERADTMARTKNGWLDENNGTRKHYTKGVLHRDGGPAEVRDNGTELYYRNGLLHREGNQPAMIGSRGTFKYAVDGKYHRLGGLPAVIWSKGPYREEYWVNGEINRAVRRDGTQEWYVSGCSERDDAALHREDGPAVIHPNGREEYWLNGMQYNSRDHWVNALAILEKEEQHNLDTLIDEDPVDAIEEEPQTVKTTKVSSKEKKMSKPSFTEMLKDNAVSAGYRVAGTQLTTLIKNAILTVMRDKGADGGAIQAFSAFLDTEFGNAMISFAVGSGLNYVPHFSDDPRVVRLAEEMSVAGMATAGNAVIGEAMQHVLPAVSQILNSLPSATTEKASNVRVIESETSKLAEVIEEEEVEENEAVVPAKTMKA